MIQRKYTLNLNEAKDDEELEERIKNFDNLYENNLYISRNVNLQQAIPNKSVKEDSQNTFILEHCSMSLEDLINRQLDKPFNIDYIIFLSAKIISAVMFCH